MTYDKIQTFFKRVEGLQRVHYQLHTSTSTYSTCAQVF